MLFICPKRDGLKLSEYADELKRKGIYVMMLRSRETGKMPMNLQFFAEGSGEGGEGNGNLNNNAGEGNSNQNTGNNNQGATYTQEQLDGIVNNRTARAEQSALKSFFQQQGMSESEVTQAINAYKEQKAKNTPDVVGMQSQIAQVQSRNLQLTIENSATLQAVELGIDSKSIPYVIKMADFKDVAGEDGTVDAEKVKAAINKVLEDVPALKPANSGETNNQGFKPIGAPNNNQNQNQDDLLRGIFGIKKK